LYKVLLPYSSDIISTGSPFKSFVNKSIVILNLPYYIK
jgi:hypothetical protein